MIVRKNGLYNESNTSGFKQTSRSGEHEGTVYYTWGLLKDSQPGLKKIYSTVGNYEHKVKNRVSCTTYSSLANSFQNVLTISPVFLHYAKK